MAYCGCELYVLARPARNSLLCILVAVPGAVPALDEVVSSTNVLSSLSREIRLPTRTGSFARDCYFTDPKALGVSRFSYFPIRSPTPKYHKYGCLLHRVRCPPVMGQSIEPDADRSKQSKHFACHALSALPKPKLIALEVSYPPALPNPPDSPTPPEPPPS